MIIYLDIVLPQYSSNLPKSKASNFVRFLFGFASGWSLQCLKCYHLSGKLLPYLFTLTKNGGIFSVALAVSSHFPGVTWSLALRSPDFPLKKFSDHPTNSKAIIMIYYVCISFLYTSLLFSPVTAEISFADSDAESFVRNSFFIFELIFGAVIFLDVPSITITISPLRLI